METQINKEDIRKFYRFLQHKNETELRLFKPKHKQKTEEDKKAKVIFITNENQFVEEIKKYNGEYNIYAGINERTPKGTKDEDVEFITILGTDVDAHSGKEDDIKIANEITLQIKDDFIKAEYEEPLLLCSGRGYWIIQKINKIINKKENVDKIKQFGKNLDKQYSTDSIKIDTNVYNPSRIARVPGTLNLIDEKNTKLSYIINSPSLKEDIKLTEHILSLPTKEFTFNVHTKDLTKNCAFLDFCLSHEVPSGDRHICVSRNLAIYLADHPNKKALINQYINIQKQSDTEMISWVKNIEEKGKSNFPFSCGQMIKFQKKYKIPIKCRGCSHFLQYKREKKQQEILESIINIEDKKDYSELQKQIFIQLTLREKNNATELLVQQILEENHIYTTRDDIKSEVWIYRDGIYIPQGKSFIKEFCRKILEQAYTTHLCNDVITKIEADTFIEHDTFFKTNYINEVPVRNGILNIITRELTPYNPNKIFFNKLPIEYNDESECPNIINHFKTILKDPEDIKVMFELFGYLLYKEYKIEKAFMFVGGGRNGKSKTLELMKRFIGVENCANLPLAALKHDSFNLNELFGKMANLAGDLSNTDLKETGTIKNLIGRDTIQAHRKFLRDLNFVNYAKICFAANELPKVYDTKDGFWTKWVLMEFPYKFISKDSYEKMNDEEKKMHRIIDTDIINSLSTNEEMSGLLNEALDGLDRLLKNEDFSYSKGTEEVKMMWIRQSDSFACFCIDCLEEDYEGFISKKELRKEYHNYCKKHKVKDLSDIAIKITLQNTFGVEESQKFINEQNQKIWEGIKFKNIIIKEQKPTSFIVKIEQKIL